MQQATFTSYVGVAPGTTTISERYNPGGELSTFRGLGVCEPGYYGQSIMLPGSAPPPQPLAGVRRVFFPYGSEAALNGGGMRWDLFALTLGIGFAGVLGFALYKRKR
jgi:hypothetical protein